MGDEIRAVLGPVFGMSGVSDPGARGTKYGGTVRVETRNGEAASFDTPEAAIEWAKGKDIAGWVHVTGLESVTPEAREAMREAMKELDPPARDEVLQHEPRS